LLLDAVHQPLTVSRFEQNVALAWHLSVLRVPKEPPRARVEQCGA
jgi:hypothetical protein